MSWQPKGMHVGILGWRPESLQETLKAVGREFSGCGFLFCCKDKDEDRVRALSEEHGIEDAIVFSPERLEDSLCAPDLGKEAPIGRKRNLLKAASAALGRASNLVLLDDDVFPGEGCRKKFESAFGKYDLVQGKYVGSIGNKIYAMVEFLDILSTQGTNPSFEQDLQNALRGVVSYQDEKITLSSACGGLLGVSPILKAKNCFMPTNYMFDDHFFEFSSRFAFPGLRYMGSQTLPDEIPFARHRSIPGARGKIVDDYILYVKAALVESYFYFRLAGCIPMIREGRHALLRANSFDLEQNAERLMEEAAVGKIRNAAAHYLSSGISGEASEQLGRLSALSEESFSLGQEELEGEWHAFEQERAWLLELDGKISASPREISRAFLEK